jgi:hypothetical protein
MLRYTYLSRYPRVFRALTGLHVHEFDALVQELLPRYVEAESARLSRPNRQRAIGAGHPFTLSTCDQMLLTVVWLRVYPTHEVLGYLFGVSDTAVHTTLKRLLLLFEQAGRDTMRLPDPGRKHRRQLSDLLRDIPDLAVVIDTFEQRVQRPRERQAADRFYSGKKKQHTLKSQVAVDMQRGLIVDVSASVPGPTADLTLLKQSGLLARLPAGMGAIGDLAYVGIGALHPAQLGCTPRRKPRGQPRPEADSAYNTAFARMRMVVEHSLNRMRRYQCLCQVDRQHRCDHTARVCAVAGLVNRQIVGRLPS